LTCACTSMPITTSQSPVAPEIRLLDFPAFARSCMVCPCAFPKAPSANRSCNGCALPLLSLCLQLAPQLLFLVLDEPSDHLAPEGLAEVRGNTTLGGSGADAVDDLLVAPGHVGFLLCRQLELPGALNIAEALRDEVDESSVEAV